MNAVRASSTQPLRRQQGLAMVEFVISAPLLLLVLYAIAEIGRAFIQSSILAHAARDADRFLASNALNNNSTGVVVLSGATTAATKNLAVFGNAAGTGPPLVPNLTIGHVTVASDASNNVSVSITVPYQRMFGGGIPRFYTSGTINTSGMTLNAYMSMRAL